MTDNRDSLAAQQAAGLRKLANMIEQHPEIAPLARTYLGNLNAFYAWTKTDMQTLVRAAKAAGADVSKDAHGGLFTARFTWGPITAKVLGDQELVCEKRVETKTVVEEVPDPEAVARLPKVLHTRVEEVVTWECKPWMAADGETAVAS